MLKAKYKMHKLVNIIFYGIVWLSGYLVGIGFKGGGGLEKISNYFNNLFS